MLGESNEDSLCNGNGVESNQNESQTIGTELKDITKILMLVGQRETNQVFENNSKLLQWNREFQKLKDGYTVDNKQEINMDKLLSTSIIQEVEQPNLERAHMLEAKMVYYQRKRNKLFASFLKNKVRPQKEPVAHKDNSAGIHSKRSQKNQIKIEKKLMNFFSTIFQSSNTNLLEDYIYKKHGYQDEDVFCQATVKYGYKAKDLINYHPNKLPSLGWEYEDMNKESAQILQSYKQKQDVQRSLRTFSSQKQKRSYQQSATKKGEVPVQQIDHQITTQQEYIQSIFQQELLEEPMDYLVLGVSENKVQSAWFTVLKNVLKIGRFKAKYRNDFRDYLKRLAYFCAKEVRRKFGKCQKQQKEYQIRAKKLGKETQSYWRKREKELIEIKKRKEKLEQERKKREEEEREQQLQKRRLEFLMKQSDIYAHFMAKKLGIDTHPQQDDQMMKLEDENQNLAMERVAQIIDENRQHLTQYDGQKMHLEANTMKELKNLQMDFSDVNQEISSHLIKPSPTFKGELKEYQLKGLRWLDNLYDQGINGILADEMGLGKTIQAIALLGLISCFKNVWGPFLVIAPSSTLHNWQQELKKFCPSLRVLPYWGQSTQRKTIRRYFNQKNFGKINSPFHVVVTSYNLVVTDNKVFHRVRWQYMILDEAQAIKNINSQRWTTLLSFNARNRLLLTGTPIQNTMGELWALLHFIMPKFFDSFDQFQEWFSKDIEAHSMDQKSLNQHQLQRLHAILKPFMLRRLKKDVEHEIGQKREIQIMCEMTSRQALLYNNIKAKLSIKDFFKMLDSKVKVENLMNLVMQFRKICNHPELFERKPYRSPYLFADKQTVLVHQQSPGQIRNVSSSYRNPVQYGIPKLVFDEIIIQDRLLIGIHDQQNINNSHGHSLYAFTAFLGLSTQFYSDLMQKSQLSSFMVLLHFITRIKNLRKYTGGIKYMFWISDLLFDHEEIIDKTQIHTVQQCVTSNAIVQPIDFFCSSAKFNINYHQIVHDRYLAPLVTRNPISFILPNTSSQLISQSAKLRYLDKLLKDLKSKHWRVLIFCQMTKMLDILEEYMLFKGYTYFRMDGQCQINDRRDMVNEYQTNDKIFAFLLSTRAGGLGITLTQADAVIFYDNDWNPTMDAQATDRAHRIGRTKDVWVYRLVTKGTIEERIVERAQQKQNVQSTVYAGGVFQGDKFKPHEVMELLFDKSEIDANVTNKFMSKGSKKKKKNQGKKGLGLKRPSRKDDTQMEQEGSDANQDDDDVIEVNLDMLEKNEQDEDDAD